MPAEPPRIRFFWAWKLAIQPVQYTLWKNQLVINSSTPMAISETTASSRSP